MKNVYLIQPNNLLSNEVFLPYAAGCLASYAWQFKEIKQSYTMCDILFLKVPIDKALKRIHQPYLVAFSNYMWNVKYNLVLAQAIKKEYPDCIVAFGGPQVPDDKEYLEKYPFIDLLMYGEGEITFYRLLQAFEQKTSLSNIENISYRSSQGLIKTPRSYNNDVSAFPSAYASGVFDSIVKNPENAHLQFSAVLETNRGCPFGCAYCYWAGTVKNFRVFPMKRVKEDIDWIASNKIMYCMNADSNFGMLTRDLDITDYIVETKKKSGYPKKLETCSAKNKEDIVFAINQKLQSENMNCGISVAVQSMNKEVLKNIGRENISIDNFSQQLKKYRDAGMAAYTDFILALPGETYESFMHGIFESIEAGQHSSLNIHPCEVLPNTRLYSREMRERFGIVTVKASMFQSRSVFVENNQFGSCSEIIIATNTMTVNDWVNAMCFSIVLQVLHSFSLLRYIAVYLRKAENVSYEIFYTDLYNRIQRKNGFIKKTIDEVFLRIRLFTQGESDFYYYNSDFSDSYLYFKEGLFLSFVKEKDCFYREIKEHVNSYFSDQELFDDLFNYQLRKVKYPGCKREQLQFEYDWYEYFSGIIDKEVCVVQKKKIKVEAEGFESLNWREYTKENLWYGKREQKMLRRFELLK